MQCGGAQSRGEAVPQERRGGEQRRRRRAEDTISGIEEISGLTATAATLSAAAQDYSECRWLASDALLCVVLLLLLLLRMASVADYFVQAVGK